MMTTLASIERIALYGLMARKREALSPILGDERDLLLAIEQRLDLPPGAIGTTHQILDTDGVLRVDAVAEPPVMEGAA